MRDQMTEYERWKASISDEHPLGTCTLSQAIIILISANIIGIVLGAVFAIIITVTN